MNTFLLELINMALCVNKCQAISIVAVFVKLSSLLVRTITDRKKFYIVDTYKKSKEMEQV
jgi:hypothetical protein